MREDKNNQNPSIPSKVFSPVSSPTNPGVTQHKNQKAQQLPLFGCGENARERNPTSRNLKLVHVLRSGYVQKKEKRMVMNKLDSEIL
jgi:hypothetical protein